MLVSDYSDPLPLVEYRKCRNRIGLLSEGSPRVLKPLVRRQDGEELVCLFCPKMVKESIINMYPSVKVG